jgi:protein-S-isoprenylcysteine O-methyltransferase Ste14
MAAPREWAKSVGFDRYDINARSRPALFALLPLLLLVAVWFPDLWSFLGSVLTLVTTCGSTFLLARLARFRGRQLEKELVAARGGQPSLIYLRHRDLTIEAPTKARYHTALRKRGLHIPTEEEEIRDPQVADGFYQAANTWLLEKTRDQKKFKMLLDENIDYGFRRNLVALKPIAVIVASLALIGSIVLIYMNTAAPEARRIAGYALTVGLVIDLALWLMLVNRQFVEDAADSYAKRMLAQIEHLGRAPPAK